MHIEVAAIEESEIKNCPCGADLSPGGVGGKRLSDGNHRYDEVEKYNPTLNLYVLRFARALLSIDDLFWEGKDGTI